jgi:hypothetical protein
MPGAAATVDDKQVNDKVSQLLLRSFDTIHIPT